MGKLIIVFGTIAALLCVIHQSYAIKCYTCGPEPSGTSCYDATLNETNGVNCPAIISQCFKAVAKLDNGTEYIIRGCDPSSKCDTSGLQTIGIKLDCYNCDTDLCNSSILNSANLITVCLTVLVAYYLRK